MIDSVIAAATAWSALRAGVVAIFAVSAGGAIAAELKRLPVFGRRLLWLILLTSLLTPDLVTGYGYSNFSVSLIRHAAWSEAFLTLLIALKATPVAALILFSTPPSPLTPAGRHLLRLGRSRIGFGDRLPIVARGTFARILPALAVAFLFAFQQFELPSLMAGVSWTVTLFDRQAMVPDLAESADPLVWPLAIELLLLVPVAAFLVRSVAAERGGVAPARNPAFVAATGWLVAIAAVGLTAAAPFAILVSEGASGLAFVVERTPSAASYWRQIGVALVNGVSAALVSWLLAAGLLRLVASSRWRGLGALLVLLACVPGLCGPLVPGLAAVELFQRPLLLPLRDSLLPVIVVLALYLLPRALLLDALARLLRDPPARHLARALRSSPVASQRAAGRRLLWDLDGFGRVCRIALLAWWGYLDLTVATILAPPGMEPVSVWLYNFMHYGRNASLSAMTFVAVVVPLVAFAALLGVRRLSLRLPAR